MLWENILINLSNITDGQLCNIMEEHRNDGLSPQESVDIINAGGVKPEQYHRCTNKMIQYYSVKHEHFNDEDLI